MRKGGVEKSDANRLDARIEKPGAIGDLATSASPCHADAFLVDAPIRSRKVHQQSCIVSKPPHATPS